MKVYAIWHGGPSYSIGSMEDLEVFPSIRSAECALRDRYESNGSVRCVVYYADKPHEKTLFPAVTHDSTMDIFTHDPREGSDWPTFRLSFGPKGGVKRENY